MSFGDETVIRMPPLSMAAIEGLGDALLEELCPEALEQPVRIPLEDWIDFKLPAMGIHVQPVHDGDLPDAEALTNPESDDGIDILVRQSVWASLFRGGRGAHRARATIAHEVGHAILHVPTIRRRTKTTYGHLLLKRVDRRRLKAFEDPEWQAWALGGCILAPRSGLVHLPYVTPGLVSSTFHISESFAETHLRRLQML